MQRGHRPAVAPLDERRVGGNRKPHLREGELEHDQEGNEKERDEPDRRQSGDEPPAGAIGEWCHRVSTTGLVGCHNRLTAASRARRGPTPPPAFGQVTRTRRPDGICTSKTETSPR